MKRFIEKTILVRDADNPDAPVYRMLVVAGKGANLYQIIDLGIEESSNIVLTPQRLRSWMRGNGFTQKSLADVLGVHQATISYWLRGKRTIPNRISHILGIDNIRSEDATIKLGCLTPIKKDLRKILTQLEELEFSDNLKET